MVIAGPGTGKTQILAMRVANILQKTQAKPRHILALTFTESATANLKKRLISIIGQTGYFVDTFTFHGFCNEIILTFSGKFAFARELEQLTDVEKYQILESIIDRLPLKTLTAFGDKYHYLNDIAKTIVNLKRENISLNKYTEVIQNEEQKLEKLEKINPRTNKPTGKWLEQEKLIKKNLEMRQVYEAYQIELKQRGRYDYEDMLLSVIEKLQTDEELLAIYQEKYLYVLVDEYQDTNSAQNKLVEILTSYWEEPNLFVVGDDDQSIFRFQGASLENLLYFEHKYPRLKKIVLTENYRSVQPILDAASSVISHNQTRLVNTMPGLDKTLLSQVKL